MADKIYFFNEASSMLMSINLKEHDSNVLRIKNITQYRKVPIDYVKMVGNSIYGLEMSGEYMLRYDMTSAEIEYIKIDCNDKLDGNFAFIDSDDTYIYIFTRQQGLVMYNYHKKTIYREKYPICNMRAAAVCKCGGNYVVFQNDSNVVTEYIPESGKWKNKNIEAKLNNISQAVYNKQNFYIICGDGLIIIWNEQNNITYVDAVKKIYNSSNAASRICVTEDNYIIMPSAGEDILILDRDLSTVKKYMDYPSDFRYADNNWAKYNMYSEDDEKYLFSCRKSQYIACVSKKDGKITWEKSEVDITERDIFNYETSDVKKEKNNYLNYFIEDVVDKI